MKVLANFEDNHKIPSNSSLDAMLGGGFEKGTITQIFELLYPFQNLHPTMYPMMNWMEFYDYLQN